MRKKSFLNNKKNAFTYLELIISMSLIVLVMLLSTPFLVAMSRSKVNAFGEYKCYARFVDGQWRLFQNERLNAKTFPADDVMVQNGKACEFTKPSGNVLSYTVTIQGGGGSGSSPYFYGGDEQGILVAPGQDGQWGEVKVINDNLNRSFAGDVLQIKFCDDSSVHKDINGMPDVTCIGKGGGINPDYGYSYTTKERFEGIIRNLFESGLNDSDENYILSSNIASLKNRLKLYKDNPNVTSRNRLVEELEHQAVAKNDESKNSGISGMATQIVLSTGYLEVARGGQGGISDRYRNNGIYNKNNMLKLSGETYYVPKTIAPKISGSQYTKCDGNDPNKMTDTDVYNSFGAPGKAGGLMCNFAKDYEYIKLKYNNENDISAEGDCYCCLGGMGAGGAISIQWN